MRFSHPLMWFLVLVLAGCGKTNSEAGKEQDQVRQAFADLQAAIKDRNADKLWALLDSDSQLDADRVAKLAKEGHAKGQAKEKQTLEKTLGLTAKEIAGLTGKSFLKTAAFHNKVHEIPDSKLKKVTVQGEKARVIYVEEDGDEERLDFIRQDKQWKVSLAMPKVMQ
jgi:hypothetical protein